MPAYRRVSSATTTPLWVRTPESLPTKTLPHPKPPPPPPKAILIKLDTQHATRGLKPRRSSVSVSEIPTDSLMCLFNEPSDAIKSRNR